MPMINSSDNASVPEDSNTTVLIQVGATQALTLSLILSGSQEPVTLIPFKRKIEFDDSISPRKQHILESYFTGDICRVVTMPRKLHRHNTEFTSPTAKRLYREASDIFLRHRADVPVSPFLIKHVEHYEPCNTTTFIWTLPVEILIVIITLLGMQDLHSVTQLSVFSHFLQSVPSKSIWYITLFWNFDILNSPVLPHIVTFLENIHASGCEELTCIGLGDCLDSLSVTRLAQIQRCVGANHLKAFEASSQVLFSPPLLPFTIQTIHFSCLEKLRMSSIKLNSTQWDKLLRSLAIPTLIELRVDADCALSMLIRFLCRHPAVSNLGIMLQPGCPSRTNRVTPCLTISMSVLDGPLSHVLPILWNHHQTPTLNCLAISLQAHDTSPDYITAILQCISYCNKIEYLLLSLPLQSHSRLAMIYRPGTHSAVHIKHLVIDYSDPSLSSSASAGDTLALSASWIEAFSQVKCITMRGYSTTTAGDLVNIMHRFAASDVELSVELQQFPML
ncbi:hypothetical protein BD769DRAFT_1678598 [Suillus cothurnatus]|nr:hypothetical protein BD769DRAFT_1678598 [Suillus cothurnatus]